MILDPTHKREIDFCIDSDFARQYNQYNEQDPTPTKFILDVSSYIKAVLSFGSPKYECNVVY